MRTIVAMLLLVAACTAVTVTEEANAIADLEALIDADDGRIAEFVRLAFHDAVGLNASSWISDGCINLDNPENAGLVNVVGALNTAFDEAASENRYGDMSHADFWALAGVVGVRRGALNQAGGASDPQPELTPLYGRTDCPTAPSTTQMGNFPNAMGDLEEVLTIFGEEGLGLTDRQVCALMGAHALGSMTAADSGGFRGPWALPETRLDNTFHANLVELSWFQAELDVPGSPGEHVYQFDSNSVQGPVSMLHTDMSMLRDIETDGDGSVTNCAADTDLCPLSSLATHTQEFADDNAAFMAAFAESFTLMSHAGYAASDLYEATSVPPPPPSSAQRASLSFSSLCVLLLAVVVAIGV